MDLVAAGGDERAFDIRSFESDERERHIEVKSTTRPRALDDGFWLAEVERAEAERDENWCVYRVWDIDGTPTLDNLGNIVRRPSDGWALSPASWV